MNVGLEVLTAGAVAAVVIEGIKWLYRWIRKDYTFEFPTKFYMFMLPVMTFVVQPGLAFLGLTEYELPTNWLDWARQLVLVVLASLVALFTKSQAIKGLTDKAQKRLSS